MARTVVEADRLTVEYTAGRTTVRAVDDVTLRVDAGEVVGLVGESGCGKSTLGRAILGLLPEDSAVRGTVRYGDLDLYALPGDRRRRLRGKELALIFQDPMTRLDPLMTVEDHFRALFRAHGVKGDARAKARDALAEVGVPPDRLPLYPHEFSGGMRQRIMIALSLVLDPKVLVADEPTTSLDVIVEAQIIDLLRRLQKDRELGVVLISHNLALVAEIADRVAVMYAGRIVEDASVEATFARAAHPYTQGLLASTIHLGTTRLASIPGSPPDLASPPAACRFHPRCPRAREICATRAPPWALADGGRALCWFPGPEGDVKPQEAEANWGALLR